LRFECEVLRLGTAIVYSFRARRLARLLSAHGFPRQRITAAAGALDERECLQLSPSLPDYALDFKLDVFNKLPSPFRSGKATRYSTE
jgi:hypothetical protein